MIITNQKSSINSSINQELLEFQALKHKPLKREIIIILILKIALLWLLWWLFFASNKVSVNADNMLHQPISVEHTTGDQP